MARIKTVFTTATIPHKWVHNQDRTAYARNPHGNFYFEGDTIYSYGRHHAIARKYKAKEQQIIIMNNNTYSSITAGHHAAVRQALLPSMVVFHLPNVLGADESYGAEQNIEYMVKGVLELIDQQRNTRNRISRLQSIFATVSSIRQYAGFFADAGKALDSILKDDKYAEVQTLLLHATSDLHQELVDIDSKLQEKQQKRDAEATARAEKREKARLEDWLAGKNVATHGFPHVYLRLDISGNFVQTSNGVSIHKADAIKLYDVLNRVRTSWLSETSVMQFMEKQGFKEIGGYSIDRVTPTGDLIAGCHHIRWYEIERFATQQGWVNNA